MGERRLTEDEKEKIEMVVLLLGASRVWVPRETQIEFAKKEKRKEWKKNTEKL